MRQDYPKIRAAGAELVVLSPDSVEDHRRYGQVVYGEPLPWLFVSDPSWDIARRFGILRAEEHPHGGFWQRSLWIIHREGTIADHAMPWEVSTTDGSVTDRQRASYQLLFQWLDAEPGTYFESCQVGTPERQALDGWLGEHAHA